MGSIYYIAKYINQLTRNDQKIATNILYQDILVTTGGSEALNTVLNSICDPGDEIIIPDPYYANYNGFSNATSVKINPILCTINNGFQLPTIKQFESKITKKTKAILICNPGNPTGALYSLQEIQALSKIIKKYDLFLIADEVYREFIYDNTTHHSVLQFHQDKSLQAPQ